MCEAILAGQIEQAAFLALHDLVVPGACAGYGFGDCFPACSRLCSIVADDKTESPPLRHKSKRSLQRNCLVVYVLGQIANRFS